MSDGDLIGRSGGVIAGAVDHAGVGATVVASVALTPDVGVGTNNHSYVFMFFWLGVDKTGASATDYLGGVHLVTVMRNNAPGWVVDSSSAFGTVGSDATPTWGFAMNGDTLEASATANADTVTGGGFVKADFEAAITGT